MKIYLSVIMALLTFGLVVGCSDNSSNSWYGDSTRHNADRDAYIEGQVGAGISPEEARRQFDLQHYTEQTEKQAAEARENQSKNQQW